MKLTAKKWKCINNAQPVTYFFNLLNVCVVQKFFQGVQALDASEGGDNVGSEANEADKAKEVTDEKYHFAGERIWTGL